MKIALLSWETLHSIRVGGIAFHVTELAAALERKGHEVHVYTRLAYHDQATYEYIHGVHYHRCPFHPHPDFIENVNNMCRAFVDAVFHTESFMGAHFDIVHAHDWLTANAMIWIKWGKNRRSIFTLHSTEYGRCGNNFFKGPSERIAHIEWEGTFVADRVIAVSQTLAREVQWICNVPDWKLSPVYNGVSCKNFDGWIDPGAVRARYGVGPVDPMVLFVGRLEYQKGPDLLVQAIPHVLHHCPTTKFVFAGTGGMRGKLENQANALGVGHAVRFVGFQSGEFLNDLFKATDCVCVPSRNEPFGIIVLEAWSAGKPVVATKNGGPSEFVWHDVTGYQVEANPNSIAWGLGKLFCDFEHGRWMGKNGRAAAETTFSWDSIADHTLGVYQAW